MKNLKTQKRIRRHKRIRAKITGTKTMPRLSVFKSNKYLYAQIIDDVAGKTLAAFSDKEAKGKTKTERAREAGRVLAKDALAKKISQVAFDRGGFTFTGRVKALAEGAREGGLVF